MFRFLKNYQKKRDRPPGPCRAQALGVNLCLARALLAAPSGPSAMCFLRHARGFGCIDPNLPSEAAYPLPDTNVQIAPCATRRS